MRCDVGVEWQWASVIVPRRRNHGWFREKLGFLVPTDVLFNGIGAGCYCNSTTRLLCCNNFTPKQISFFPAPWFGEKKTFLRYRYLQMITARGRGWVSVNAHNPCRKQYSPTQFFMAGHRRYYTARNLIDVMPRAALSFLFDYDLTKISSRRWGVLELASAGVNLIKLLRTPPLSLLYRRQICAHHAFYLLFPVQNRCNARSQSSINLFS